MALHDLRAELGAVESLNDSNGNLTIFNVRSDIASLELFELISIQVIDVTAHVPNSLPVPPLPSREVCRQVGGSSKFAKAFKEMAHKTTTLQMDRLKAVARGNTTSKWDRELVGLSKRWNHQVDQALQDVQREHGSRRHRLT
ncbi:hypothetical protein C0992_004189 [Termitomyces sp. T32_za158]|nr:hypothetical protein C0992_004189 [Termitomyces sp. T32_za158]